MPEPTPNPANGTPPQPPVVPTPAPAARPAESEDGDDDPKGKVPSFRLRQEREKRTAVEEAAAKTSAELAATRAELESGKRALAEAQTMHSQETHLLGLGFGSESVRRFLRREYSAAVAEVPADKRLDFGVWLEANKADPLYAPHFEAIGKTRTANQEASDGADLVASLRELLAAEQTEEERAAAVLAKLREVDEEPDGKPDDPLGAIVAEVAKRLGVKTGEGRTGKSKAANPNAGTRGAAGGSAATPWTGQAVRDAAARNGGKLPQTILDDILVDAEAKGLVTDSARKRFVRK